MTGTADGFAMPRPGGGAGSRTGAADPSGRSGSVAEPGPERAPHHGAESATDGPGPTDDPFVEPSPLPPDASIDIAAVRAELGVDRALDELDASLVGLAPVKERLRQIESLHLVDRLRQRFGRESPRPNLHMCFAGPPGTGKTTVATKLAEILHALGYLPSNHLVSASREDLVGQYVGHTGPRPRMSWRAPWVGCCSSTRPLPCTGPATSATAAGRPSRSSSR